MAVITISRGTMSGGSVLAELLAERLGYTQVRREVIQEAASKLGVSEDDLGDKMRDAPMLWKRQTATRKLYLAAVQATLADYAAAGNVVYHGLAGQLLLKGLPTLLRVRLIAPMESRVRTVMEQQSLDRTAAEQYIRHVDAGRARWVKMMYGENVEDPSLYDMVVNLEVMSIPAAAALVAAMVECPEYAVTDEVKTKFADFQLRCHANLALVSAAETRTLDLTVAAKDGIVEVSGAAPILTSGAIGDSIVQIIRGVPGVVNVKLKMEWYDPYP